MGAYDWLVVGAGFTGAVVAERLASQLDQKVLVVDRRGHVAGNAFDETDAAGLWVHRYGPHIFHTNSAAVWDYLSRFTAWRPYAHRVLGDVGGQLVPIPFNLNTLEALFPPDRAAAYARTLIETFGAEKKVPILQMLESSDAAMRELAAFVYAQIFENYTIKQWGLRPDELAPHVTARVPVFISRDNRYFQDTYQAMPAAGYTALFDRMLAHPHIHVSLDTDFSAVRDLYPAARVIFTGPIDAYFDQAHGALPYRSLRFETFCEAQEFVQPVGTVNYPNAHALTRITEMKHLTAQQAPTTLLMREYPVAYVAGENEPYYPIPTPGTAEKLKPYRAMADELKGKVWFAGRLGDYAYYNMDQACARALALFETIARG